MGGRRPERRSPDVPLLRSVGCARTRCALLSLAGRLFLGGFAVTAAYFAPELFRLVRSGHQLGPAEVERRGRRWQNLNWGRLALMAATSVLAAVAAQKRRAPRMRRFLPSVMH